MLQIKRAESTQLEFLNFHTLYPKEKQMEAQLSVSISALSIYFVLNQNFQMILE